MNVSTQILSNVMLVLYNKNMHVTLHLHVPLVKSFALCEGSFHSQGTSMRYVIKAHGLSEVQERDRMTSEIMHSN